MVTKRTARSFVEEDLLSENRECRNHQQQKAVSMNGNGSSASALMDDSLRRVASNASTNSVSSMLFSNHASADELHATFPPLDIDPNSFLPSSNNNGSSSASISSSSYSSSSSTISDNGGVPAPELLAEEHIPADLKADASLLACAPHNFGEVVPGIYRSSYPKVENYPFLERLGLKTIVTLVDKNFTEGYCKFMTANNIEHHMIGMKGTKKEEIPLVTMEAILHLVLDRQNYPLLIHCNHGKHRTGCVVAVIRKIAGWDTERIVQEYRAYAGRKVRDCDVKYIRTFQLASISDLLESGDLDLDGLADSGDGAIDHPTASTALAYRIPNFFRATFFSMTVLIIWMISGSKIAPPHKR